MSVHDALTTVATEAPWMAEASCREVPAELFFTTEERTQRDALALCATCPVREACLEHAIAHGEMYGIWGGTRETERRARIRGRRRRLRQGDAA